MASKNKMKKLTQVVDKNAAEQPNLSATLPVSQAMDSMEDGEEVNLVMVLKEMRDFCEDNK